MVSEVEKRVERKKVFNEVRFVEKIFPCFILCGICKTIFYDEFFKLRY
jgi:hypothetical protein